MSDSDDDRKFRRFFQRLKSCSNERAKDAMNKLHTRAYAKAQEHYGQAMDILLSPKQKAAVEAKAAEIRELWDGMHTITIDETEGAEFFPGGGRDRDADSK